MTASLQGIGRKMAKGAAWMVLLKLTQRCIGLISTLVLARLLIPADFGLIAMAMSILAILELLTSFNFDIALIQNQNAERRHYDTAWTFNVLFGFAKALGLIVLAVPASIFFEEPRLVSIILAFAISVAVDGFGNIGVVAFQKDLDLRKEFRMGIAKKLISFTVTLTLAILLRNYWALIAGTLTASVAGVVLSYKMQGYRPQFSMKARKELFHFSKWMLLSDLLIALAHRGPDFVLGKLSGPAALGIYGVAYEISNLPTTELVFPIGRAVFPGYSKMVADPSELRRGFVDVLSVILLVTVPAGFGIAVLAEPLVQVLLGAKWVDVIPLIQVLAIFGILRASMSNTGSVYLALGRPKILTWLVLLYLAVLLPGLYWLVREHGAYGAAIAALLAATIQTPVAFAVVMRQLGLGVAAVGAVMWRPVTVGVFMGAAVYGTRSCWLNAEASDTPSYLFQLVALVPFGALAYVATIIGIWFLSGRPHGAESILLSIAKSRWDNWTKAGAKPP